MNQINFETEADTFIPPAMKPEPEPIGLVDSRAYANAITEGYYWNREAWKYRAIAMLEGIIILIGGIVWIFH